MIGETAPETAGVFADLAGQDAVVAQLRRAAAEERPTHAWLFTGPPGSGRSTAARAFAAALQCESPDPLQRGCGRCHACRTALAGTHPDVTVLATEGVSYRIEDVRALVETGQSTPATGRWRIFLMEDADRMTERATNVLLKAIEEPPERTVWMLCSPSPADVLPTIRSRCRLVTLRIPAVEDVAALLHRRDGLDTDTALLTARISQSHVGMARRLARDPEALRRREAVLSLPLRATAVSDAMATAAELAEVSRAEAESSSAARDAEELAGLRRALGIEGSEAVPPKLRHHVKRLEEEQARRRKRSVRDALDRAMIDVIGLFRDVLRVQLGAEGELINEHRRAEIEAYARGAAGSSADVVARIDAVAQARTRLAGNVPEQLALEAMMLALLPRRARSGARG
ncbi:DNA polymerase III subunit delta' [Micrococcus sp. EYE_162]|uniref:DNA polymerase III subunit delta' n=1 Tax=Micrococcus TaxID=1269 RepID=UPI00200468A0|nr:MULTISPECIES: DNA polymerase III subunit delta' [unclassified Micrococcus]MCK6096348.1 DNA polymerase III subunit delta' [Micrococcus sp. EYE_212]MCK6172470.1 DNA polymerase III subunit delta' [Micrococcus sp. EYE_162]MDX2342187.1 DNA polymerase III subunit delta' [Micrococcus sp. M4NT]